MPNGTMGVISYPEDRPSLDEQMKWREEEERLRDLGAQRASELLDSTIRERFSHLGVKRDDQLQWSIGDLQSGGIEFRVNHANLVQLGEWLLVERWNELRARQASRQVSSGPEKARDVISWALEATAEVQAREITSRPLWTFLSCATREEILLKYGH